MKKQVLFATLLTLVIGISAGVFAPAGNALVSVHVPSRGLDPMQRGAYLNAGYTDKDIREINSERYDRYHRRGSYNYNRQIPHYDAYKPVRASSYRY